MYDDLQSVYATVASRLSECRVVPILGAGVNLSGRPSDTPWEPGRYLPDGRELSLALAQKYPALARDFPMLQNRDLAQVAQYITALVGQRPLYDDLHSVFDADYPTTQVHRFLARQARRTRLAKGECMLIVTTNYDAAMETAFEEEGEPYELVTYIADGKDRGKFRHFKPDGKFSVISRPNKQILQLNSSAVIAKIHGAVNRSGEPESFVITEDHYIDYLTRADIGSLFPVSLARRLKSSHLLFLGYSLRDWNLRVMLYRLWGEQAGVTYKSWAVQPNPDWMDRSAWEKRGVEILPVSCEDFVTAMEAELGDSPSPDVRSVS